MIIPLGYYSVLYTLLRNSKLVRKTWEGECDRYCFNYYKFHLVIIYLQKSQKSEEMQPSDEEMKEDKSGRKEVVQKVTEAKDEVEQSNVPTSPYSSPLASSSSTTPKTPQAVAYE